MENIIHNFNLFFNLFGLLSAYSGAIFRGTGFGSTQLGGDLLALEKTRDYSDDLDKIIKSP